VVVRHGDVAAEVARLAQEVGAGRVHVARDASAFAARRERRLRAVLAGDRRELVVHDGVHSVVAPGAVLPTGSDHFAVFTPYWRRWAQAGRRAVLRRPMRISTPDVAPGQLPAASAELSLPGGESEARRRVAGWLRSGLDRYGERADLLAEDGTSRLSPYLHLGCISAAELEARAGGRPGDGPAAFVRQLAWRDFHLQLLTARPHVAFADYRPSRSDWHDDPEAADAWRTGHTGFPVVDAGMRQLAAEGWMHNRARLITGSFLTKTLGLDWRIGASHFFEHLLDGDIANNCLNWQWVAGTGTDTRPGRALNPVRQGRRFDPDGEYVRRWVPELSSVAGAAVHEPWRLRASDRPDYPQPVVEPGVRRR
jgi:deoxyribodipyrimidine photo-lyase